jgi:putative aldouronate transport system permease protein
LTGKTTHHSHVSWAERTFDILNVFVLILFAIVCIYPFYYIFIYSISLPSEAAKGGIYLWPKGFSIQTYIMMFKLNNILQSVWISVARTVSGTIISVFATALFGYLLQHQKLPLRKLIYRFSIITMFLQVGLIPWYVLMKSLGLKNSFLLYIIPGAISMFNVVLVKTFVEQIPPALEESAMMDGAGPFTVFRKIIFPLSLPILATIAIFCAVGQWNTWMDNLYLAPSPKLQTLQLLLLTYLTDQSANMMSIKSNSTSITVSEITPSSVRMAMTMIVTFPIVLVYPFFQRYFTSGIMLGAVKG